MPAFELDALQKPAIHGGMTGFLNLMAVRRRVRIAHLGRGLLSAVRRLGKVRDAHPTT
jgi:hypothetical protein